MKWFGRETRRGHRRTGFHTRGCRDCCLRKGLMDSWLLQSPSLTDGLETSLTVP